MPDIAEQSLLTALEQLGGRDRLVPGALLAARTIDVAHAGGLDFKAYLRDRGLSFARFLTRLASEETILVVPREGTDILVGFAGATTVTPTAHAISFRGDVYAAFSRVATDFYYHPDVDRFTPLASGTAIKAKPVSFDDSMKARREFANTLPTSQKDALQTTLGQGLKSFGRFAAQIRHLGLTAQWKAYFSNILKAAILEWAGANSVPVRDDWFQQESTKLHVLSERRAIAALLEGLTDEDLDRVLVPLSVALKLLKNR